MSLHNITCSNGTLLNDLDESKLCSGGRNIINTILSICTIVLLIIACLTCVYYNYKTEIYIYCFSSKWKILRLFVSHPDIDVDKKYDSFISYSHEDEKFVLDCLVPELEENGDTKFKLCLHFRDWMPGESIPNQILHSVQNSRRTIVVLSPNFLKSVWGKVEFRTAHCEALKDGTARVIVILYKEVGPVADLDEELRAYLQMNTYVKWGSPSFWQQLKYALPHPPEDVKDAKCIFDCFSRTNRDSRGSHKILKQVYLEDGLVHYMSDVTEKIHEKVPNTSADTKNTPLIIESVNTKLKDVLYCDHEKETVAVSL